jgi:tetratricopeptide (TPR) repeat protein
MWIVLAASFVAICSASFAVADDAIPSAAALAEIKVSVGKVNALLDSEDIDEAIIVSQKLLELLDKTFPAEHPSVVMQKILHLEMEKVAKLDQSQIKAYCVARRLVKEALGCISEENTRRAVEMLTESLEVFAKHLPDDSTSSALALTYLGAAYIAMEKPEEAQPYLLRAVAARKQSMGINHPDYSATVQLLGTAYYDAKKVDEAEKCFRESTEIERKLFGNHTTRYGEALNNLAEVLIDKGSLVEAEVMAMHALLVLERSHGQNSPLIAPSLNNLAKVFIARKEYESAKGLLRRELDILTKACASDSIEYAWALERYAKLMRQIKDSDDVAELEVRAAAIRSKKQQR